MPILTNPQIAALQRVLATCNSVLPRIEMLEAMAAVNPNLKPRVGELRSQREYLCQLATTALEIDRQVVQPYVPPPPTASSYPAANYGTPDEPLPAPVPGATTTQRQWFSKFPPGPPDANDRTAAAKRGYSIEWDASAGMWYFQPLS